MDFMPKQVDVLVVDDDEAAFLLVRQMLTQSAGEIDFRPEWVSNTDKAIELMKSNLHQVVLMDYMLGEHTGLDVIRNASQQGAQGPFILLTGKGSYQVDLEAMEADVAAYLNKEGLTAAELERTIRYSLAHKQREAIRLDMAKKRALANGSEKGQRDDLGDIL